MNSEKKQPPIVSQRPIDAKHFLVVEDLIEFQKMLMSNSIQVTTDKPSDTSDDILTPEELNQFNAFVYPKASANQPPLSATVINATQHATKNSHNTSSNGSTGYGGKKKSFLFVDQTDTAKNGCNKKKLAQEKLAQEKLLNFINETSTVVNNNKGP